MKADDIEFILSRQKDKNKRPIKVTPKDEVTEEEAIQIYNEIINVMANHNISYRCAYNISISLMYAFMTGAAELYEDETNP